MVLITPKLTVWKEIGSVPEEASKFYIMIDSSYLSESYNLLDGDRIIGEILGLITETKEFPEFIGKQVTLILKKSAGFDHLHISKKDWETNFRDWGIVRPYYRLKLALKDVVSKTDKKATKLYEKRDLELP